MKLSQLSYLFSIIIFCGPILLLIWKREARILKKYEITLLATVIISLPIAVAEFFALKWGAWKYFPDGVLDFKLGAQLESYLFWIAFILMAGSITLILAAKQDKQFRAKRRKNSARARA